MLSRTADHLFWMARYMERAENTARMLDVNYQSALLPQSDTSTQQLWQGLLSISELTWAFHKKYSEVNSRNVTDFMVHDETNGSSIFCCLRAARENARAVRGALTTEVWETQNQTWLEFNRMLKDGSFEKDPGAFFEWVKFRSHLSRGVTVGTMLQDEALHFLRIGTFLERADNTARLLDVKFQALAAGMAGHASGAPAAALSTAQAQMQTMAGPAAAAAAAEPGGPGGEPDPAAAPAVGADDLGLSNEAQEIDFYHWSAILRSVSGFEIYRKVYRNVIRPEKVAELLILRPDMPRSLAASMQEVVANLKLVANAGSDDTVRRAGRLQSSLQFSRIDEILAVGLHTFLTEFLENVGHIGAGISRDFLVPGKA